jgi:GNAT superfamily N-acetyltransferase
MSLDYTTGNQNMFYEITELWNIIERYDNLAHIDLSQEFVTRYYKNAGINPTKDVVLVRKKNGRLSAFGSLFFDKENSKMNARLNLMVHPFYRGQGIGSGLLYLILKKAENVGCKKVTCVIPNFRSYSIKFMEEHGFKNSHTRIKMQHENIERIDFLNSPKDIALRTLDVEKELGLWTSLQNNIFHDDLTYNEVTIDSIARIIKHRNFVQDLVVIGEIDDAQVGICIGWPFNTTTLSSNTILRIYALGVVAGFRRKGYGQALISEVLQRGLKMGYKKSELLVKDSNFPAKQLYNELGFREKYKLLDFEYEI